MRNGYFRKISLSFLFSLLCFTSARSQVTASYGTSCIADTLFAAVSGTVPNPAGVSCDDCYSGVFPIGFTFTYYGNNYTQCVVGSNGVLSFNTALAGGFCPWSIAGGIPGNATCSNAISGVYSDVFLGAATGGSITYATSGTAPNRKFSVTWCASAMFSCTTQWLTSQIIIYETSNNVEVHIAHKDICAWNGGAGIVGVQNAAGTVGTAAPGRNFPGTWSVLGTPEAWRFTPSGGTYICTSIPYNPLPFAASTIYWYNMTAGGTYVGTGSPLVVYPTVTTTYKAAALSCRDTVFVTVTVPPIGSGSGFGAPTLTGAYPTNPTRCGRCDGRILLRGIKPHQIDTVHYTDPGGTVHTFVDSAKTILGYDSAILISPLCGGTYTDIYITVGNCPSPRYTAVLVTPVLAVSAVDITHPTVCGKNDGSVTIHGLSIPGDIATTTYTDPLGTHTVVSTINADSTIVINNLVGYSTSPTTTGTINYTFTIHVDSCTTTCNAVLTDPPPYIPSFDTVIQLGCAGDKVTFINLTTPTGHNSYWDFGDGGTSNLTNTEHTYMTQNNTPTAYVGSYLVTLTYNTTPNGVTLIQLPHCKASVSKTINIDHQINADFSTDLDTVCLGIPFTFTNLSTTHYNPTYKWTYEAGVEETTTDPTVNNKHTYYIAGVYNPTLTVTDEIGCVHKRAKTETSVGRSELEVVSINIKAGFGTVSSQWVKDTTLCLHVDKKTGISDSAYMHALDSVVYSQKQNGNESYHVDWTWYGPTPSTYPLPTSYLGNPNVQNPTFAGVFTDQVFTVVATTNYFHCSDTAEVIVTSRPPVVISELTPTDQTMDIGGSIQLHAGGAGIVRYWWTPDNGTLDNPNISNPVAHPVDTVTIYTVHGMNLWGCEMQESIRVFLDLHTDEFVPSAFTPNGDGMNDVFRPMKLNKQKLVDFRVTNRYGQVVYQTATPDKGWDGTFNGVPQDMGTYHYMIIIQRPDGTEKHVNGTVDLIR